MSRDVGYLSHLGRVFGSAHPEVRGLHFNVRDRPTEGRCNHLGEDCGAFAEAVV